MYDVQPSQYGKTFDIMINTYEERGINLKIYSDANYKGEYYYRMINIVQAPKGTRIVSEIMSEKAYSSSILNKEESTSSSSTAATYAFEIGSFPSLNPSN